MNAYLILVGLIPRHFEMIWIWSSVSYRCFVDVMGMPNEYDDDIDDFETRYEREPLLGSADGAGQNVSLMSVRCEV